MVTFDHRAANGEMVIELYFADQLVPTGELFRAMQAGTIDAVQSDDDSMSAPTDVRVFGGYFPFATRYSLDVPALFFAALFILYIFVRCHLQPSLGPPLPREERELITWGEKIRLLRAGILPLLIIFSMTGLFVMGATSIVESSAVGALAATLVAGGKGRITRKVLHETLRRAWP